MSSDPFAPKQRPKRGEPQEGEHILTQEMRAVIERGEALRIGYMRQYRTRSFIATTISLLTLTIGGCAFGWLFLMEGELLRALGAMVLAVTPAVILTIWAAGPLRDYKKSYKQAFLPELAKALGQFQFHPARGIPAKILAKTGIGPKHEFYYAEDCFMGRHKEAKIILSEARLRRHKQDKSYIFDGLFAMIELSAPKFRGHTIVTADAKFAQRMNKLMPVDITGSGCEDKLSCFTSEPAHSEKFRSPELLKEIEELADVFQGAPLSIAFFRGKYIFCAIPYKVDMFEPSTINVPITTRSTALRCKQEIEQILSMIDIMDHYETQNIQTNEDNKN